MKDISVLITTFLRDGSLEKCINVLDQNIPEMKAIIIDDGYKSPSKDILYRRLGNNGHAIIEAPFDTGLSEKRNIGVKACETKYLLMGCDDFLFDHEAKVGIEKLYDVLESNPNIALA